jgi:hypothetical protein
MTISVLKVNAKAFEGVRVEQYLVGPDVIEAVGNRGHRRAWLRDESRLAVREVIGRHRILAIVIRRPWPGRPTHGCSSCDLPNGAP